MCTRFFSLFFLSPSFALLLCLPHALCLCERRERHAYCDFVGGSRAGGAESRRSCGLHAFWWCIHCVGAVRALNRGTSPRPPHTLSPPASKQACFMLQLRLRLRLRRHRRRCQLWLRIQVRVFVFENVWAEFGVDWDWDWARQIESGTGVGAGRPAVRTGCCPGSHRCDWGLFMAHGFWVTFWYHVLAGPLSLLTPHSSL